MDWPAIVTAVAISVPLLGALILMVLKNYFVTRGELQSELGKREKLDDSRHNDNQRRLGSVESTLGEVREMVARIDGELTGQRRGMGR